ncbi:2OG-Fe(II) oxygenase [Thalassospira sp. HJ]|uniref:2OG-Fe(II) oxygenase n=1 Tax=Thalassospira sp. HJ TaxID=1616823 RepID=UPI000696AAA5|nr:2OG-Fe(II) oxygenase [Thalassospira sp. HJ]
MRDQVGELQKELKWINPKYSRQDVIEMHQHEFHRRPQKFLVLDDFVQADALRSIRKLLLGEGQCEEMFRRYRDKSFVEKEKFYDSHDEDRFIHEFIYRKPASGKEMAPSTLEDVKMRAQIQSEAFHSWLRLLTGRDVQYTNAINLKRLDHEHFLRWHNDSAQGRVLCMVLYLHEDWQPGFGGRLQYKDENNDIHNIDPLFNRVVIFDSNKNFNHAVEPMTPAATGWKRLNYSAWFQGDKTKNMNI